MSEIKTTEVHFKEAPEKFCKYLGHELSGALYDIQNHGIDDVCIRTIARVSRALGKAGVGGDAVVEYHQLNVQGEKNENRR